MRKENTASIWLASATALIALLLVAPHITTAQCSPAATGNDDLIECTGASNGTDGLGGNDTINIVDGAVITGFGDPVQGGAGDDVIIMSGNSTINATSDGMNGNDGNDLMIASGNSFINATGDQGMEGDNGNDTIIVTDNARIESVDEGIRGDAGDDLVIVNGNATINSSSYEAIRTGSGADTIIVGGNANLTGAGDGIIANAQDDVIIVSGNAVVTGTNGAGIKGLLGNDTITIKGGTVTGGNGTAITGGDDDDTITINITATINGVIDGGNAVDTLTFRTKNPNQISALAAQLAALSPAGGTLNFNGRSFTWVNFEQLRAILISIVQEIVDDVDDEPLVLANEITCPNAKLFHTPDDFIQVYAGFGDAAPDGFLVAVFAPSDANVGDVYNLDDPTTPAWSIVITEPNLLDVLNENGGWVTTCSF